MYSIVGIKGLLGVQPHLIFIVTFVYIHVPLQVVVHLHRLYKHIL